MAQLRHALAGYLLRFCGGICIDSAQKVQTFVRLAVTFVALRHWLRAAQAKFPTCETRKCARLTNAADPGCH